MFRSLFYMSSTLLTLLVALQTASAQTQPTKDYGYFSWIECTDGYGGALAWNGYPLENAAEAARYPSGDLHNVHIHILKSKEDVERDGKQAHDRAVKLCAGKIALYSRVSNKLREQYFPSEVPSDEEMQGLFSSDALGETPFRPFSEMTEQERKDFLNPERWKEYHGMDEDTYQSFFPTDQGHVVLFSWDDRLIGVTPAQDMRALTGFYAQYLMSQRSER